MESIINFFKKHTVIPLAMYSVVFAIIIHFLFKIKNEPEWLRAEWGAGDILTYASTVALGLLALWQNKRFKEENDISQARLEKLTEQANNLTTINKIIEIESDQIKRLKISIENYEHACDLSSIINLFVLKHSNEQEKLDMMIAAFAAKENIKKYTAALISELGIDKTEKVENTNSFTSIVIKYSQASIKTIDMMSENRKLMSKSDLKPTDEEKEETKEQAVLAYQLQQEFALERDLFLQKREALLDKIIFGNYTVDGIRQLLKQEIESKKSIEEENKNAIHEI